MRLAPTTAILALAVSSFVALGNQPPLVASAAAPNNRQVTMMDACDGPTFNFFVGPGACNRDHGVSFPEFIAQLIAHQSVGAWRNAPSQTDAWLGDALTAINRGGEVHTFTAVHDFGAGLVPILNVLAGIPGDPNLPLPECAAENVFVSPGGSDAESLSQAGQLKFQCCIHPWMRTTVLVKSH